MHPILIRTQFFTVYSYGALLSLAFLAGMIVAAYFAKREKVEPETVLDVALWVIISAIAGARALYVVLFWHEFAASPIEIVMVQHGGLIFYGGLMASLAAMYWRLKRGSVPIWKALDIASPAAAAGYSIARIGCFLNGCCAGLGGLPTQLYSSASAFAIFLIILLIWRRRRYEGQIFLQTVVLYSTYRFLVEFLRTEPRYFALSSAQWISMAAFIAALCVLVYRMTNEPKK